MRKWCFPFIYLNSNWLGVDLLVSTSNHIRDLLLSLSLLLSSLKLDECEELLEDDSDVEVSEVLVSPALRGFQELFFRVSRDYFFFSRFLLFPYLLLHPAQLFFLFRILLPFLIAAQQHLPDLYLARGKLARVGGSLEPPKGGGGSWQWGSCDRTLGKVPIFFAIFAIFSLNSGTNSRRSPRGTKGARAVPRGQFPSALNGDARVLMFHRCEILVADPKGRVKSSDMSSLTSASQSSVPA